MAASIDKWINSLYIQISEILLEKYSSKKCEYTFSMIHYTSFNKKEKIRQVKMSVSLWERKNETENKKLWTKLFATRSAAVEFLSAYLDQISMRGSNKKKYQSLLLPL